MKKIILTLMIVFSLFLANEVEAKNIEKDLFQSGNKVRIRKDIDGTSFIAGNDVSVNARINGIGFIAGQEVKINSDEEYIFTAGREIKVNSSIEKDAFIAGETIKIKNSNLKRDAYLAANSIYIDGNISRNLYAVGTKVTLSGNYDGNVTLNAEEVEIKDNTKIRGTLKYNENAKIIGTTKDMRTKTYKSPELEKSNDIKVLISNLIISYIHIALLAIVLVFMFEKLFKKSLNETKDLSANNILSLCGKGLVVLIGIPIVSIMLICTGVFISIGVVSIIVYGLLLYSAKIFTAYALATKLDKQYFKKNMNNYMLMIVGLLIIYVLGIIPFIGSLISFISTIIGLGIISNMILKQIPKKN